MTTLATFARSSVGKKVLVAITGLMLLGFVIIHLLGNLTLFIPDGGESFNHYTHFLETLGHGWFILVAEAGLIAAFLVHAVFAVTVAWVDKRNARPTKYAVTRDAGGKSRKTLASRSMIITGPILLVFVIIHVNMFKYADHPRVVIEGDSIKNLYTIVDRAFSELWIVVSYMAVMVILGTHLFHGVWSAFQSMGWNSDRHIAWLTRLSWVAGIVLGIGFLVLPLYMYLTEPATAGGH